ncbi:Detected protein of unknown function [Hibiscus syriacus]|uniref:DUF674 domain-containing protein n=1 Tax=Hibiscus syriacus TaxID=106335 RepID=A0A6A3BMX6_HIBSY|nr:uncharacterized protein LOC120213424 [Hibiscus syriacus]KAE8717994.1 Detected protein of unknown function [Hibiscus syriacus]
MAAPRPTTVRLKLLIAPKSQRVLYAEADKDFVDFLFNILSLPVGTVVRLLNKQGIEGCIRNIYESIENVGDSYMQSAENKDILLKPMVANYAANVALLLPTLQPSSYTNLYRCDNFNNVYCRPKVTTNPNTICPSCSCSMKHKVTFVNPTIKASGSVEVGFVKGAATYMVMDDLVVRPMSTESIITLLSELNIKDVGDLEVEVVGVGIKETVELLRALIWSRSKAVLTTVFLSGKKEPSVKSQPLH